ncbi:MAG: peptidase domain-containing ABC transporter, partial [Methylobacteriaceae bacterium]|nr:peptidase domain-containing ABC transporter [Methylobacteriaceae bacterium]MBV9243875.1 peptidase domain-containing ABC transporter [Methylobacteriaceae bacterium]
DLPIDFFERPSVGAVTHDMNEIWRIRNFLTGQLFGTVLDSFVLLVFFPVMFFFSPGLTAIVLACCVLIFLWIVVMLPPYRRRTSAVVSAETRRGTFLVQTIHGIRTVKSLALDARHRHEWDVHVARIAKLRFAEGMMANLIQTVVTPLERFLVSGTFALGIYFAMTTNDPVYVGALFAFLLLSQRVAAPLVQMAQLIHQYDEARLAVGLVADLVNQPPEEGRTAHGVRTPIRGHVEFSNVRFKYKGSSTLALDAVTFEVPQGTTLGIMGRSGSGKTTITRLLQRLHSNYQGLIKIDGIDVREYDVDHLRSSLGVVLQENFLFSGTIRENITAAKSDATFEEVVLAARMAGAEEFIDKLPRGYETYVYEGSPNLSGGQRQRLAIARALIVDPRILILDEATSALDAESEAIINANLQRIGQGRTLIVISHRLSSLVPADAILVLERGEVHDIGRHQELLERCDIYSGLWYQQNRHVAAPPPAREKSFVGPSVA